MLENKIRKILIAAPIQKARISAEVPYVKPSKKPTAIESFASPKPIHRPPEKNQSEKKKKKNTMPAIKLVKLKAGKTTPPRKVMTIRE